MQHWSFKQLHLRRGTQGDGDTLEFGRDPRRDWRLVFITFLLLDALAVLFSVYMYARINQGEIFLVEKKEAAPSVTLDRAKLEKTVALFAKRREQLGELSRTGLSSKDPSDSF